MLQPLNQYADRIEESHLSLCELNLLYKPHQSGHDSLGEWHEMSWLKFPCICDFLELPSCRHSNDLIIERITCIEKMLEDLTNERYVLVGNLDGDPLPDHDSSPAPEDVVARFLLLDLHSKSVSEKCVEV